jgi:hypothetical protein
MRLSHLLSGRRLKGCQRSLTGRLPMAMRTMSTCLLTLDPLPRVPKASTEEERELSSAVAKLIPKGIPSLRPVFLRLAKGS